MTSLADDMFAVAMDREPLFASLVGVPGWDDRIEDLSPAGDQAITISLASRAIIISASLSAVQPLS